MNPNQRYGRTIAAPVHILPELTIDVSGGQPLPPRLGKTEVPVHPLPELTFDFQSAETTPILQLHLYLRSDATPAEVACDLFRLWAAVNQLDRNHSGMGLTPDGASRSTTPVSGTMQVTFKPTDPVGAEERLTQLVRV
jgi:hypothetical protein